MIRYVAAIAALTLVYALALASFHPWDLFFGAALSAVLVFASRRFVFGTGPAPACSGARWPSCLSPPWSSGT